MQEIEMDDNKLFKFRNIIRVVIEAESPIAVGSGEKDFETDARVIHDVNGLPYIPATSLAGILRHYLGKAGKECCIWGFQKGKRKKDELNTSCGSRLMFTDANLVRSDGTVVDGMLDGIEQDEFLNKYLTLPIRQHVRLGHQGSAEKHGKFDEQVVYVGTRFCFELESAGASKENKDIDDIVEALQSETLRVGSGVYKGFGKFKVVSLQRVDLDLENPEHLHRYLTKSSSLNNAAWWTEPNQVRETPLDEEKWQRYDITLQADDFFMVGSGVGDDDADLTPVHEHKVVWENDASGRFERSLILIPATSVKGALSHRVAFHYNKLCDVYADRMNLEELKQYRLSQNEAVKTLFGTECDENGQIKHGHVLLTDVLLKPKQTTIFNHVRIDRFTGGVMDGALFNEKVLAGVPQFTLTLLVEKSVFSGKVKEALERAIKDLITGMLPLGGAVNRGHGIFTGSCPQIKNNDGQE